MQIIQDSRSPAEPVVVISVGDLEELVKAARRPASLADMFRFARPAIAEPLLVH